jgi:hypothetical protein
MREREREEKRKRSVCLVGKNGKLGVKLFLLMREIPLRCFWPFISPKKLDQS